MSIATSLQSLFLAVIVLFASVAGGAQPLISARDDPAWREVVTSYFLTYAKKDIEGVLSLWSGQSPQLPAERKALTETFAAYEKIEVKDVTLRRVTVEGEQAAVRAAVEMNVTKKGESASRIRKLNYVFQFVREAGAWKVSSGAVAEKELAALLAAANTDAERQRLLTQEHELLTVELREALLKQVETLRLKGSYPQALVLLDVARRVAEQINDRDGLASVLRGIGNIHVRQGNHSLAEKYFQESLELSEALGDKALMARALSGIADVLRFRGKYSESLDYYRRSLALREELGDQLDIARALGNIGVLYHSQGDYAQALDYQHRSLAIKEALGDKVETSYTLGNIGIVHQSQGDYNEALDCFRRSLKLSEALGDLAGISSNLSNIGISLRSLGDYAQALEYAQKALALKQKLGDKVEIARILANIGVLHQSQGDYAQALEYYQKSLALREALSDKIGIARTMGYIGGVHRAQGNGTLALEYHQKSLAVFEALGNKAGRADSLVSIGNVYLSQGNYAQALDYYQKYLEACEALGDKDGIAIALGSVGNVYLLQRNFARAEDYYRRSLALKEALGAKDSIAITLNNLGELYQQQGRHTQALDAVARAAALARQTGTLGTLWESLRLSGTAYLSLDQPGPARQALMEAIDTIETMRGQLAGAEQDSQRFFENKLSPYLAMTELNIRQHNVAEALTFAERAKARVLLDVLRSGRANVTKAMTAREQDQERQLTGILVSLNSQLHREGLLPQPDQNRLTDLKARLHTARLDYEAFQTSLYAAHPELKVKRGEASPLRLDEAVGLLPNARSALLEYVVTEEKTWLFVLTRSAGPRKAKAGVQVFTLDVSAKELSERAANFRQQLATRDLLYRQTAVELYELLLGPARELLKGKRLLTIVPDGTLWELPFQALQPMPGHHLIEDSAIAYAPSLTVLRDMNKARTETRGAATAPMSLLAVGNPVLGTENVERFKARLMSSELTPLPEAEEQVRALQRLYGAEHSKVYVGVDAREERVKADAGKYRILHLATHGIYDDASPMYSQVVLANEAANAHEDGFLEAWEIVNLNLHADLVVLSACETARGRVGAGEGMIGLAWALFVAGSPSIVVSQWKVDAASTTTLMLEFHRGMRAGNSKAGALQQATLKVLQDKKFRHPFYWAPFVLIGNAN